MGDLYNALSVSTIIPCYNSKDTILKCLNSVIKQNEPVDEIVIIDDGSTDNTRELVLDFIMAHKTFNIKMLRQVNSGPSAARNNGVRNATSDYIAFLDSDDEWYPDHIKSIKEFLERHVTYELIADKYQSAPFKYTGEVTFKMASLRNYFITPCVLIKKQIFLQHNGFNEQMQFAEDHYLWLNVLQGGSKGYFLPDFGSRCIENKRPFGEKGLSANLRQMHRGVLKSFRSLLADKKISHTEYLVVVFIENLKYIRRVLLSRA